MTSVKVRKKMELNEQLDKFNSWNFKKSVDVIGTYCKGDDLYFKKIENNKYLVFNHYNAKKIMVSGFDCWISTYSNESQIGNEEPINNKGVQLSFHLNRDFDLIKNYVI